LSILVLGSQGFIGSKILEELQTDYDVAVLNRHHVDFMDYVSTIACIKRLNPRIVINAVGRVAGVKGNLEYPVELLQENAQTSLNILRVCHELKVENFIQFGSACVYPIDMKSPSKPSDLGTAPIEKTSKSYAMSKLMSIELLNAYRKEYKHNWITMITSNLYGSGDWKTNSGGHVVATLSKRFLVATNLGVSAVTIWGDGKSRRNFLNVSDLANATKFVVKNGLWDDDILNVNGDPEITIKQLSQEIAQIVGFKGEILFDRSMPNGARRKALDDKILRQHGWKPEVGLRQGLENYIFELSKRL